MGEKYIHCANSVQLFNGDKVKCPEYFGEKELVFVGMAKQLKYNNDCVVIYDGECVPVILSELVKLN